MTAQALFAQAAIIAFMGAALMGALLVARRGIVAPLVAFGALVLVGRACGFALNYFAAEGGVPPVLQVVHYHLRSLPIVVLTIYVCLMQARRYRAARNNDFIRALFLRVPYVYGGGFVLMFVWDLISQPPVLEYEKSVPVSGALAQAAWFAVATVYGGLAALVFFRAVGDASAPLGIGQRLQNLFFGIALAAAAVAAPVAAFQRSMQAFSPEVLTPSFVGWLSTVQLVTYAVTVAGIVAGILSYYYQSKSDRFLERFSSFLDLVGDLAEEISDAVVGEERLTVPHAAMHQAAGPELLDLSPVDVRRMDNAFCARVVWQRWAAMGRAGRIRRRRLRDLAEAYNTELREPVLREGLQSGVCGQAIPEHVMELLPEERGEGGSDEPGRHGLGEALALVLDIDGGGDGSELPTLPEWGQLVYVAMVDAGLLPQGQAEAVLDGRGISEEVLNAYRLAEFKIRNYGNGAPPMRSGG
jgi:hypothetical protein